MDAKQLYHENGKPTGVYHCGKCGTVYREEAQAQQCCDIRRCTCGAEVGQYRTVCLRCDDARETGRERKRFEQAEKLTDWAGWVYTDIGNENYFPSLGDLLEHCELNDIDLATVHYVWACKSSPLVKVDIGDILERISDDGYEDCEDDIKGKEEFAAAIRIFEETNKDLLVYTPDYTKAVLITEEDKA